MSLEGPPHSESWYFNIVDTEQQIEARERLGLAPNLSGSGCLAIIRRRIDCWLH